MIPFVSIIDNRPQFCARRFVWKQALKLGKRVGERQFVSIKHVDNHERSRLAQMLNILPLVGGCYNRISTEYSCPSSVVDELAEIQAQEEKAIRILQRARNLQKNTHKGSQDSESENSGYAECHAHDEFDSPQPAENNNDKIKGTDLLNFFKRVNQPA